MGFKGHGLAGEAVVSDTFFALKEHVNFSKIEKQSASGSFLSVLGVLNPLDRSFPLIAKLLSVLEELFDISYECMLLQSTDTNKI